MQVSTKQGTLLTEGFLLPNFPYIRSMTEYEKALIRVELIKFYREQYATPKAAMELPQEYDQRRAADLGAIQALVSKLEKQLSA